MIIQQYLGGAHCCYHWRIYNLYPDFRLIFDSKKYPVGDSSDAPEIRDIDKDGIIEFIHASNKFAYFDGLCFVCSPRPLIVFKYDKIKRQYFPANHIFPAHALKGVAGQIERAEKLTRDGIYDQAFPIILDVILTYIYAGRGKQAWAFYEQAYKQADKRSMRRKIMKELRSDSIYHLVYAPKRKMAEGAK